MYNVLGIQKSFSNFFAFLFIPVLAILPNLDVKGQRQIITPTLHHIRSVEELEWEEFKNSIPKKELHTIFSWQGNETEHSISIRQYDVKQEWHVFLNGKKLGSLVADGNDMRVYYPVAKGLLINGENILKIIQSDKIPDDIRVGEIFIDKRSVSEVLGESRMNFEIREKPSGKFLPSRLTIVNESGSLQSISISEREELAHRPGILYTGNGKASFKLPAGKYRIYASRGFEYGIDSFKVLVKPGQVVSKVFMITKEVSTHGWISSDTHIHTLTNSGHGDATSKQRLLAIAGEGIELPVFTEHNAIHNYRSLSKELKLDSFFTNVAGNELTTSIGHFNQFPFSQDEVLPDHKISSWKAIKENLPEENKKIIILNHGRDIHNGFRPFDPSRHISIAGMNMEKWDIPANAMEVINSGALLNDRLQLFKDWFGLLNRGIHLSPIGASDSHDVGRYLVGQARTYIRGNDNDPSQINISEVIKNLKSGKVSVSFGLFPEIMVNEKFESGDLASASGTMSVRVTVGAPGWIKADQISIYSNGIKVISSKINNKKGEFKWSGTWKLNVGKQDFFLVAIAEGEGTNHLFWPIVKPYQPTGKSWKSYVAGITGAVWIDADGDGKPTSGYEYAKKIIAETGIDLSKIIAKLSLFDEAVAVQMASLLYEKGVDLNSGEVKIAINKGSRSTREGFEKFTVQLNEYLKKVKIKNEK